MFSECDFSLSHSSRAKLQLLPYFASFHAVFKYMQENNLPIVVSLVILVRFNTNSDEPNHKLHINSKCLLFDEFQKCQNTYVYKNVSDLSDKEKLKPTIAFTCFSVIHNECPEHYKEYM